MDVLNELLGLVKLQGALFFNGEFSSPWCVLTSRSAEIAPNLSPSAESLIIYHFLTEGRAYASLPEGRREELTAGDIVIFPHGMRTCWATVLLKSPWTPCRGSEKI